MRNEAISEKPWEEAYDRILALLDEKRIPDEPCMAAALDALVKQMPMAPTGKYTDFKCGMCGRRVRSGKGSSSFTRDNFCQRCGQRIAWGD